VVKNIYYSPSIDRSDYSDARTYYHNATGQHELMHLGAYFDPGMEFDLPSDLMTLSKGALEDIFNSAFTGNGIRIIKSHIFATNIDFLKTCWPDCPVVLVHRNNDSCLGWWVKCGHFDITYPDYSKYYQNLQEMSRIIAEQNNCIEKAMYQYLGTEPQNNRQLAQQLGLLAVPEQYSQNYTTADITLKVI
jgi:hypothetical protein